jgi:ketosteroid isomerase-like protein
MSEENVAIVRAIYERWAEGDFHGAVEFFDPEVAFVIRPGFPTPGRTSGPRR